jgi:hypothetical protein
VPEKFSLAMRRLKGLSRLFNLPELQEGSSVLIGQHGYEEMHFMLAGEL